MIQTLLKYHYASLVSAGHQKIYILIVFGEGISLIRKSKKRTRFFQIFLESKRSFAKGVRDLFEVECPSVFGHIKISEFRALQFLISAGKTMHL